MFQLSLADYMILLMPGDGIAMQSRYYLPHRGNMLLEKCTMTIFAP